ncbi:unnamed protein product, partial [Rotaria sordida]
MRISIDFYNNLNSNYVKMILIDSIQSRPPQQNFSIQQQQQQQQIKQELMAPPIQQQQSGLQVQQMRTQQQQQLPPPPPPPPQYIQQQQQQQTSVLPSQPIANVSQQRTLAQHLQQVRQQNQLNQQQDSSNSSQLSQQQQQPTNSTVLPQSSSSSSSGSQDEILQHILTSPNPPKQPPTVAQVRLRTMNRNARNQAVSINQAVQQQQQQQQPPPSTIASGSDSMMSSSSNNAIQSPHSHPGMMQQQQQQTPIGPPGQSPLARYMMAQSPQGGVYRPPMSPMNMINYTGSPTMIDEEMHFLFKFFTERIQYLTRIIARCQQEGTNEKIHVFYETRSKTECQSDKVAKYRQLHDQISAFIRNLIPEHLMAARRLKEHVDRMLGPIMMPPMNDMSTMSLSNTNGTRLMTNGIFEQCQRTIADYLNKDSTLKYNIAKRFLEPLSEVLNGVPH